MKNQTSQTLAALALFVIAVASRVLNAFPATHTAWLQNFSPLAAICLCGAAYLSRGTAVALPLAAIVISDVILNVWCYHFPIFNAETLSHYLAFVPVMLLGFALRSRARLTTLLPASLLGSILFYVITNTMSWLWEPAYAKTLAGFIQSQTAGVPGQPAAAWEFFRSTATSDILFTTLFVLCMAATGNRERREPRGELAESHAPAAS